MMVWRFPLLFGLILLTACSFGAAPAIPLVVQETTTDARVIRHALGETRISPTDFLMFAIVFSLGFILTRFIQA
ncbi:MAG: hypothetical protein HC828_12140, partial [Blastochloris sp.]|nr:hypothetical protein [Blastochloris sp.]